MRLVQIARGNRRKVAVVEEPELALLGKVDSVYSLANRAVQDRFSLTELASSLLSGERLSYDEVYAGRSEWKLLAPIDCPGDPQKVLISGTGLTHLGSARERAAMHASTNLSAEEETSMTDSMRMFEWGRAQGRPPEGSVGIAPEWFYKGDGSVLQAPFAPLEIPEHAEDGGEEAEIATVYLVDTDGVPHRLGMAAGNEFSDHVFERKNYLNLAGSKLRMCSLGPELVVDPAFADVPGRVRLLRSNETLWEKKIRTGEDNMAHSLGNLEHHHFKFAGHRQPGMVHVHFLGADALSFGEGVRLREGDVAEITFEGFGRALRNPITVKAAATKPFAVSVMK